MTKVSDTWSKFSLSSTFFPSVFASSLVTACVWDKYFYCIIETTFKISKRLPHFNLAFMFWAFRGYQTSFKSKLLFMSWMQILNFPCRWISSRLRFALKILFYARKTYFHKHSTSFIEKQFNPVLKTLFLMKTMPGRDILLCVSYVSWRRILVFLLTRFCTFFGLISHDFLLVEKLSSI